MWSPEDQLARPRRVTDIKAYQQSIATEACMAHICEYTTRERLTMLGIPTVLGLLQSPLPHRTIPAASSSTRLDPSFNPTVGSSSGCHSQSQFVLSSVEGVRRQLECWQSLRRICRSQGQIRAEALNPRGQSIVQLRKSLPFLTLRLTMQWLPRTLSIRCLTTHSNLCMSRRTSSLPVPHHCCRESVFCLHRRAFRSF